MEAREKNWRKKEQVRDSEGVKEGKKSQIKALRKRARKEGRNGKRGKWVRSEKKLHGRKTEERRKKSRKTMRRG